MNDPLIWFWFGCAVMMLFWVVVFYRQRYLYRAKRLALVNRYRTWLQLKRVMLASSVSVGNSLGLHVKNVERNNHQWEETCKALRTEVDKFRDRNNELENRNVFLERKCKAILTIISTGYVQEPVSFNPTHNCVHCRQLGLRYCINEVIHGKKEPPRFLSKAMADAFGMPPTAR